MSSKHSIEDSLRHIVENAELVARHLEGVDKEVFAGNEWSVAAGERCIERVCEAVFRLGDRAEELMPGQPWRAIRGMGNRLRHAYDGLNEGMIWETIQLRLPELADAARLALDRLTSDRNGADER